VARTARAGEGRQTRAFPVLLDAARTGDESAFAELYRDLHPRLVRYLRVVAGDGAEDLAAETWMDVVRGWHRFAGDETGFRAWLFTIARRRSIDACRAAARRPLVAAGDDRIADLAAPGDAESATEEAFSTEAALQLLRALPPDQAGVLALRVIAGLDVAEVARVLRKRPGTVRVQAHRGLRALAEILGDRREL
jgi:RNA polymerase sigma-70 factor, ECF subfamily